MRRSLWFAALLTVPLAACREAPFAPPETQPDRPAPKPSQVIAEVPHGRVEQCGRMRVVHLTGTPEQRGRAHGQLLGKEIIEIARAELIGSFRDRPFLLNMARAALPRLVRYPKDMQEELRALFDAMVATGADRQLAPFKRQMDFKDLQLLNALDIFGTMGCSGFTVWGEEVVGGGVLTTRNFDWPVSGKHLVENCIVLVQHQQGRASVASVTWPGYVATVTGVNEHGVAVFLHVGSGKRVMMPRAGCLPTAVAARNILEQAGADRAFAVAQEQLEQTSPPASYITRVVLPESVGGKAPVGVFEADHARVMRRQTEDRCVVTNHFFTKLGKGRSPDSQARFRQITERLGGLTSTEDGKVAVEEAWQALERVQRSGRRFATLHSLVFRHQPFVFEVALGQVQEGGEIGGAPGANLHQRIPRSVLFP